MSFFSWFIPQLLYKTSSKYNADIRVVRVWGKNKLLVNRSPQSGPSIRTLWRYAFSKFHIDRTLSVNTILVLGIGGGTVIEMLRKSFPHASIDTVDIDPEIISIAHKYFSLGRHQNLRCIHEDAVLFVNRQKKSKTIYDLLVVDLFIGFEIPGFVSSSQFLENLESLCTPSGRILINYLRERDYGARSKTLYGLLKTLSSRVEQCSIQNNRFFLYTPHDA